MFTRSPFVLVFALLGPVIALASMADSRRRARVQMRQQRARFEQECQAAVHAIHHAHDRERQEIERKTLAPSALISAAVRDSERWGASPEDALTVRLGVGRIASGVVLESGAYPDVDISTSVKPRSDPSAVLGGTLTELKVLARILEIAPVVADASMGIGVFGARAEATALATSIAIQLAASLSPSEYYLEERAGLAGVVDWSFLLPHCSPVPEVKAQRRNTSVTSPRCARLTFWPRDGGAAIVLCVADEEDALPSECRIVVRTTGSRARILRHPDVGDAEDFVPDFISLNQAQRIVEKLHQAARAAFPQQRQLLPDTVALGTLWEAQENPLLTDRDGGGAGTGGSRNSLVATVGIGMTGPVRFDLVADGPHAIVGGTTGSGKSEVLVTWILSLAAAYPPREVNFLLIDFKGGAAFSPVQTLPHTVGVVTDLDQAGARRAILSLKAELQRRERILSDSGARSIAELAQDIVLPRLLIVVDEFAAMTASFIDMHEVFTDLAARGRSLGLHLILCTQRPSGTIRDAILANCSLRVSLRVNNAADSSAVIGTPDAAKIPKNLPGRSVIVRGTADVELVQWAMAGEEEVREITARTSGYSAPIQRPWLDPLPSMLVPSDVASATGSSIAFGLTDIPEEQRQAPATYIPGVDGNLFIVGAHRSGKSTTLATLMHLSADALAVPSSLEGAWDTVAEALKLVRGGKAGPLITLDDLDLVAGRFAPEHEATFLDRVMALVREGPRSGTAVAITATAVKGRIQAVASMCSSTLVLRMRDRQDHVLVGGDAAEFSTQLPPGGGYWRGHRIQVCFSPLDPDTVPAATSPLAVYLAEITVVVATRPEAVRARLEKLGCVLMVDEYRARVNGVDVIDCGPGTPPTIILGDPDAWLSAATLLGALRSHSVLVFHDCSLTEFRAIARVRELPPPMGVPEDTVVLVHPNGQLGRATLVA